jgi:EAL domain-containing protein (putative c-di-GMP-specific phosphodiesterase class I)
MVADCAEDLELIEWLVTVGVDYAQGYGIDRPKPLLISSSEMVG